MALEIGYWGIRGLGAPLRMLCEYAGVEYKDVQYTDFATWFQKDKPALQEINPLANLPYVKDGETVVTQSNSCFQYLGMKFGLDPKDATSKEFLSNIQILNEVFDLRNKMIALVYPFVQAVRTKEEFEAKRAQHLDKDAITAYEKLEKWIVKAGTPFFSGTGPMSGDFHAWEMLDQHELLAASCGHASLLENFPKLQAFYKAFRDLPQLAKYFASDAYKLPVNNQLGGAYFY